MGKKKRRRRRSPPPPLEIGAISTNFYSAGDRTEQTSEHMVRRAKEQHQSQDCYLDEGDEEEDELEMKELPHKDFNATKSWKGRELLERLGWKEGEGLGKKKEGVLNPITPDERYSNSKMGLGTSAEVRSGIVKPSGGDTYHEWPQGDNGTTSPTPWSLPSYLNKKHYKKGAISIPNSDMLAIRDQRLSTMELNLAKGGEKHYSAVPFEKIQLKKVWSQIVLYRNEKKLKSQASCDLLLEIGWWIHMQATKEALSDLKLYKEEVARLWYYVDLQVGAKHSYQIFLNDIKERLDAQLYTDFAADDKAEVIVSDDDDNDVIELFGQKTPKTKRKKIVKAEKKQKPTDFIVLD